MKILHKYVLKEHCGPLMFALSALTSIMMLNYIAKQLGALVGKGLPGAAIAEFLVLSLPHTIALALPMAVLVTTLYAFSRLAAENEITALKASGVGLLRILTPVLIAGLGVTVVMIVFNDQILPRANHRLAQLQSDIAQTKPTFALREQVINELPGGRLYLRTNHLDERSNRMREVTIYDMSDATLRRTIYADSGNLAMASNRQDLLLTLYNGYIQDVPVAQLERLQRAFFNANVIRVENVANQFRKSTADAVKSEREMSVCEMQQEIDRRAEEYELVRAAFLNHVAAAHAAGTKLTPAIVKAGHPLQRPRYSLGQGYCALLRALGAQPLGAQSVPPPQRAVTTSQAVRPAPQGTPQPVPPSSAHPGQLAVAPPSLGIASSDAVDVAQTRLADIRQVMADYAVEIHKKFALAVACCIFVMLGAPIALRFPRGGVGLTIGVSLFVFALYYVGLIAGESLANHGLLSPGISMWAANIVFGAAALLFLVRMDKGGETARGGGGMREMVDALRQRLRKGRFALGFSRERRSAS